MKRSWMNTRTGPEGGCSCGTVHVRHGGLLTPIWLSLALALCAWGPTDVRAHLRGISDFTERAQHAEQLVRRAGDALGGAERLSGIDRLRISVLERQSWRPEAPYGRTFKLWLPDRFQSRVEGVVTHTLIGGRVTFDREVPPEAERNAQLAIPATFRRVALAFLLRAPGVSGPTLKGETSIAGLKGTLVEFTASEGSSLKLLLEPASARPLALVYSVRALGSNEQIPDVVWRLEDYRTVDGVKFPFRLTMVRPKNEIVTEVQRIEVNPRFTPADFSK